MIFLQAASFGGVSGGSGTAGNPVVSGAVDGDGNLILTLTDGTTINCGVVFDGTGNPVTAGQVNGSGELVLTLQDGTEINAGTVTPDISADLDGKVDKVPGKQLSTEDFTTPEKTKLANLPADAEANIPYIVADHAMTAGTPIEKTLTNNQTSWDLQAFALKEELPTVTSDQIVNAAADSQQSLESGSESPAAVASQISVEVTQPEANVVQAMASAVDVGQTVTASEGDYAGYPKWQAFDHTTQAWFSANTVHPQTLAIDLGSPKAINRYRLAARLNHPGDRIEQFILQGSDDGAGWIDIDDQTGADVVYDSTNWFDSASFAAVSYRHYRLYITASGGQGYPATSGLELLFGGDITVNEVYSSFTPTVFTDYMTVQAETANTPQPVLLESAGSYYTLSGGVLSLTSFVEVADIAANGFISADPIDVSAITPFSVITLADSAIVTTYDTGHVSEPASLFDLTPYNTLNDVQITAPIDTLISVSTSLGNYQKWNGSAWQSISNVNQGNTLSEINNLTSAEWAQLGLTEIGIGYFNPNETVATATASLNLTAGDSGAPSAWIPCDTNQCTVRWYEDKVTFTASEDGVYKLGYQDKI